MSQAVNEPYKNLTPIVANNAWTNGNEEQENYNADKANDAISRESAKVPILMSGIANSSCIVTTQQKIEDHVSFVK